MKTIFSRILACGLCVLAAVSASAAPATDIMAPSPMEVASHNIKVVFVDHEPSLSVGDVINQMRHIRSEALDNGHSVIFYMPNNSTPFISLVNLGEPDDERASDKAFGDMCFALNQPSHNKDVAFDRKHFIEILSEFNVIQEDGTIGFLNAEVEFWLTEEFWQYGYNESILAPIYFALDVPTLIKQDFSFNVYVDIAVEKKIDRKNPFGSKNFSDINSKGIVNTYYF